MLVTLKSSDAFQIDDRVAIAIDALDEQQKAAVGELLSDREHFLTHTSQRHRVRKISKSQPVYAVNILRGLDLIYEVAGDAIHVLDLMSTATLERFGAKEKSHKSKSPKKQGRSGDQD